MNYKLLVQMAFQRCIRFPGRTTAMGLGILISIFATILMLSTASGFVRALNKFNARMYASDAVVVYSSVDSMSPTASGNPLKVADLEAIRSAIPDIVDHDPQVVRGRRDIRRQGESINTLVYGVSERAPAVRRRGTIAGEFFDSEDVQRRARVAVLGTTTARRLFGTETPIGQSLFVDNIPFEIRGVLEPFGVDPHGIDLDDVVQIPYTTMMDQVLHVDYVSSSTFIVSKPDEVNEIAARIEAVLRDRHQIATGQEDDFQVVSPERLQQRVKQRLRIFDIFIPLISGAAFLISGLIILVVLMLSTHERTGEIGLRKALGATRASVQWQITVEVMMIALVAAGLGLLLATLVLHGLAPTFSGRFGITDAMPSASNVLLAIVVAVATAVLATAVPARRAASQEAALAVRSSK